MRYNMALFLAPMIAGLALAQQPDINLFPVTHMNEGPVCSKGKPCGDTCIEVTDICHVGPGSASYGLPGFNPSSRSGGGVSVVATPLPTDQTVTARPKPMGSLVVATVQQIIDPRTIVVLSEYQTKKIRLIGLADLPPSDRVYAAAVRNLTQIIPPSSSVYLEYDAQQTDTDGVALAYVWQLDNLVNLMMLERGLAQIQLGGRNQRYAGILSGGQTFAQLAPFGMWIKPAAPAAP